MKILYYTEAELFKHKRKMYPQSLDNMGDGYSQYQNEKTRIGILQVVKKVCSEYLGSVGHAEKGGD